MKMTQQRLIVAAAVLTLGGCAAEPVGQPPRQDAVSLPRLEGARTRADHEQIAAWYERESVWTEQRAAAHRRMLSIYASLEPGLGSAGYVEHCQSLILRYQQAAESYRALALLHSRLADEATE